MGVWLNLRWQGDLPTVCITTKHSFTQLVASNIFTSSGSPWILPSQTINEWQTASALNTGPQGRLWSAGKLWMSWKLKQKRAYRLLSDNTKQHKTNGKKNTKLRAVKVPSWGQTTHMFWGLVLPHQLLFMHLLRLGYTCSKQVCYAQLGSPMGWREEQITIKYLLWVLCKDSWVLKLTEVWATLCMHISGNVNGQNQGHWKKRASILWITVTSCHKGFGLHFEI